MATPSSALKNRTESDNRSRKVRVVAKVRPFSDTELEASRGLSTKPWITVHKPNGDSSEKVSISFGDQPPTSRKEAFEVNYCYEQHEDNFMFFSKEIKPLIADVFDGRSASVIAYGAKGSGKTCIIQGSDGQTGLSLLAVTEILSMAKERGNLVTVSYYEVYHDHVYDLLDSKRSTVHVLKDAQGKIQLKGLSQVPVKEITEFKNLYLNGCDSHKATQKIALELPRRSHKGLVLHVSSYDGYLNTHLVGQMNFVDMAGYEDARRKSIDDSNFTDNARVNKTLYALQNVVYALNANDFHVPYRESKLTRMLQDSLGGDNRILLVTCLNPSFCQDTIHVSSLASRIYQGISRGSLDSVMKTKSAARPLMPSSSKKAIRPGSISASVNKQTSSRMPLGEKKFNGSVTASEKKSCGTKLRVKGRKLFEEANKKNSSKQVSSLLEDLRKTPALQKEEEVKSELLKAIVPLEMEIPPSIDINSTESSEYVEEEEVKSELSKAIVPIEKEIPPSIDINSTESSEYVEEVVSAHSEETYSDPILNNNASNVANLLEEDLIMEKNNISVGGSPTLTAKYFEIRHELENRTKALCSSIPLCFTMPVTQVLTDTLEPKTPIAEQSLKLDVSNITSPLELFKMQSTGMKKSLVKDCLKFVNSASKEQLKGLKGIGEKRATYILELREESPEHFKDLEDLKDVGLSEKQITGMMKKVAGDMFT